MSQPAFPPRAPMYPWPAPEGGAFTAEDLLDLPSGGHRYEIIDGALLVTPPSDLRHQEVADDIMVALRSAAPPGWRAVRGAGIRIGDSTVVPDITVLRPGASSDVVWADPADVALVVEVESPGSRRHDRFTKLSLYAEAGIECYWRVERTAGGPVAHLYHGPSASHYHQHRSVNPGDTHLVELPYALQIAPATWST